MSKGGAREGAGRKVVKDKLKVFNFRLSNEELKKIDKLGVGKNSSEKLRYILRKYKSDKINSKTRRAAYKIERSSDIGALNEKFSEFIGKWKNFNKNEFLLNSNLVNIIVGKKIAQIKSYIENNEFFDILETFNWKIDLIDFQFKDEEKYEIIFQKDNQVVSMSLSESEEDLHINLNSLYEREEELFSFLFEDLQNDIYTLQHEQEPENFLDKIYANGDHYKLLEYGNITIAEFEYIKDLELAVLTTVKNSAIS